MIEKHIKDSAIHYWTNDVEGKPCIVFLHPAFADHTLFDEQVDFFGADYKLIIPDLIGHGNSLGKGTITDTASEIAAIMAEEGVSKIHLVGISIGAVLAADFSNRYPEKLASLICIGGYDINHFDKAQQKAVGGKQTKMVLLGMLSIKKFAQENKKISAYTPEGRERFYQMNLRFQKSSFRYLAELGDVLNKFQTPKRVYPFMIGVGEHDSAPAVEISNLWAKNEPRAKFVVFPGAGHIVNLDTPESFHKEVLALIESAE